MDTIILIFSYLEVVFSVSESVQ